MMAIPVCMFHVASRQSNIFTLSRLESNARYAEKAVSLDHKPC